MYMSDFNEYMFFLKKTDSPQKYKEMIKLIDIWKIVKEQIETNNSFKERLINPKKYSRDTFYKWIETQYIITGNSKTGRLVKGVVKV